MTYFLGDSIETKIANGEFGMALIMLLDRVKALEPEPIMLCRHEIYFDGKCIHCGEFYR